MKISARKKNERRRFALPRPESICCRCGMPGKHYIPPMLGDPEMWVCPDHQRMAVTVETSHGPISGSITGDPNMPEKTRAALAEMMRIAAEQAMSEAAPNSENDQ